MPALDSKEIPLANLAGGEQDTFELFARDFLHSMGYKIVSGPDRGADGGRDIIVLETRRGIGGETQIKWLVSCKHKAHSGASITLDEELDILDRLRAHECAGFIGFYSTLPASSVTRKLQALKSQSQIEFQIFDRERIELELLSTSEGNKLASRYFPNSFAAWSRENPQPVELFRNQGTLNCEHCGRDLLNSRSGIIVIWKKYSESETKEKEESPQLNSEIVKVYWCCRGDCDQILKNKHYEKGFVDGWDDISDVMIPTVYLKWVLYVVNAHINGRKFSQPAFEKMNELLIALFPFVSRGLTLREKERIIGLVQIPAYMGGLGG